MNVGREPGKSLVNTHSQDLVEVYTDNEDQSCGLLLHARMNRLWRGKDWITPHSIIPAMSRVAHEINKVLCCRVEKELETQAWVEDGKTQT